MKKRLIALVALAAMVLSMLPVAAFGATHAPNPDAENITIDVIEFNNDMTHDQVIVSIDGSGVQANMPVYVIASGQVEPVYSGRIYATGKENNFYIDKEDIPGITSDSVTTLTVSVWNIAYTQAVESQVFDKVTVPNAPEKMEAYFDNAGGTEDRELTVKFDADYVSDSSDQIVLQALDADGDEIGQPDDIYVSSGKFASGLDSNDMRTLTFSQNFDFDEDAVSVRISFERNGAIIDELDQVVELESPYGELDELVLDFGGPTVAQGDTVEGKLYYVNTDGKRYDITDEITSINATGTDSDALISRPTTNDPSLTVAEDATLGSTITVLAFYHSQPVNTVLTIISDADPGEVRMSKTSDNYGEEIGVEFTLLDDSGNPMKLNFFPNKSVTIRWIDSSDSSATMTVNMTDQGSNLQSQGIIRAALECDKPCSGKFEITFTDDKGNAYQVISDTFTFKDPDAKAQKVELTIGSTTMKVDGANKTITDGVAPLIYNNRTFVPLRAVAEAFGGEVLYVYDDNSITITLGDDKMIMHPGDTNYTINGVSKKTDTAPYIVASAGRTMVPFRVIGEELGYEVNAISRPDGTTSGVVFTLK